MGFDITILTESRYDQPAKIDWYVEQVLIEDRLVADALRKKGLAVQRRDWADPSVDWGATRAAIFRTTWDYFHRLSEFNEWLNQAMQQTVMINSEKLIRWNMDKHYLGDLTKTKE